MNEIQQIDVPRPTIKVFPAPAAEIDRAADAAAMDSIVIEPKRLREISVTAIVLAALAVAMPYVPEVFKDLKPVGSIFMAGGIWLMLWAAPRIKPAYPVKYGDSNRFCYLPASDSDLLRLASLAHRAAARAASAKGRTRRRLLKTLREYSWCSIAVLSRGSPLPERAFRLFPTNAGGAARPSSCITDIMMWEPANAHADLWKCVSFACRYASLREENAPLLERLTLAWAQLVYAWVNVVKTSPMNGAKSDVSDLVANVVDALGRVFDTAEAPRPPRGKRWLAELWIPTALTLMLVGAGVLVYSLGWEKGPGSAIGILGVIAAIWVGAWQISSTRYGPRPNASGPSQG